MQSFEVDLAVTASSIARCEEEAVYDATVLLYLAVHRDEACQPSDGVVHDDFPRADTACNSLP